MAEGERVSGICTSGYFIALWAWRRVRIIVPSDGREQMGTLAGRVALVTGASQGIGRACALALAAQGAHVALAARNADKLAEVAAEIAAAGGTAHAFVLDIAEEESIKACAKAVVAHFGKLEILVNNAGITRDVLALRM